jgi:hypothetical protein
MYAYCSCWDCNVYSQGVVEKNPMVLVDRMCVRSQLNSVVGTRMFETKECSLNLRNILRHVAHV